MSFYDSTPVGHILSFFAKHLFLVDEILPETALQVLSFFPIILGILIIVSVYIPWFWATLPVYFVLVHRTVKKCQYVCGKFQQLECIFISDHIANNKSPMFAHLSATLEGLFSIRLYGVQDQFDIFNKTLIDADHKALYSLLLVRTFMALCLDSISSLFIYISALFIVLFEVSPARAGLTLTMGLQLLLFVPWFFKMLFELNLSMESVSALIYFSDHVRKEVFFILQQDHGTSEPTLPPDWPKEGEIKFKNVSLRYQKYGVVVLKNVSFHIRPKEKIAIVGRSGSGKSTLLMALMRIAGLEEGQILIDGVDTSSLSLTRLRSRIAVIPQEPVMLTGTIRSNLDPFEKATDEEIWAALHAVHLGKKIQEMPAKLETCISGTVLN